MLMSALEAILGMRHERARYFFYIHIKYHYKVTFYYTLKNCAAQQDDAMGAKINDNLKLDTCASRKDRNRMFLQILFWSKKDQIFVISTWKPNILMILV